MAKRYVWEYKGFEFSRDDLASYDADVIVNAFWSNYGPVLKKRIQEWQLEIAAEKTEGAE